MHHPHYYTLCATTKTSLTLFIKPMYKRKRQHMSSNEGRGGEALCTIPTHDALLLYPTNQLTDQYM